MGDTIGDVRSVFLCSSAGVPVTSGASATRYSDVWFYLPTAVTRPNESTYDQGKPLRVMVAQFFARSYGGITAPVEGTSSGNYTAIVIASNLPNTNSYSLQGTPYNAGTSIQNVLAVVPGAVNASTYQNSTTGTPPYTYIGAQTSGIYWQFPGGASKENMIRTGVTSLSAIRVTLYDEMGLPFTWISTLDPKWVLELKFA